MMVFMVKDMGSNRFLSPKNEWVKEEKFAGVFNFMSALNLRTYYAHHHDMETIIVEKGNERMYIIGIGSLFYGDDNKLVTNIEDAFRFNERSDTLEIQSWLEYHRLEDVEIIEVAEKEEVNTYKEISDIFGEQKRKGIQKYGQEVDESELSAIQWVDHAREEIADFMVYLTKLRHELVKIECCKGGD